MGKQNNLQQDAEPADAPVIPTEVFVARQPIYDAAMAVTAYELLYRPSPRANRADITNPGLATIEVVTNAALEIGLKVPGRRPAHPREFSGRAAHHGARSAAAT